MRKFLPMLAVALLVLGCDPCTDVSCLNLGVCAEGICECPKGYSGSSCEIEDLCVANDVVCENDGTCTNGVCDCEEGFSGEECEIEDLCITQDVNCLNGGECVDGSCDCFFMYQGADCSISLRDQYATRYNGTITCTTGGSNVAESMTLKNDAEQSNQMSMFRHNTSENFSIYFSNTQDFIVTNHDGDQVGSGFVKNGNLRVDLEYGNEECEFLGDE